MNSVRATGIRILMAGITLMAARADQAPSPRTLTLQEAVRMALERAPEVAVARAQEARAGEAVRETRALNLPQIVTGTGLAYNNGFPLSIEGAAPSIIQFGLSQSILSKKNKNLLQEAEENRKASQIGSEAARGDLISRTALLYYDLHQARKLVVLWEGKLKTAETERKAKEALLEAGRARPVDVTLAKTATAHARQELLVAQEQVRLAESELKNVTGLSGEPSVLTVEPMLDAQALDQPAESLYQRALEANSEILRAEANVRAKEFHVEAERGEYFPRLEIVSQYAVFSRVNNYQDYFNRFTRNNYLLGLSIQVPLFNGFRTSARVAQGRQEAAEARLSLERLKSVLRIGIEQGASQLRIARGAESLARMEVGAATENLKVQQTLFEGGRISPQDLEAAQASLREKEISAITAQSTLFRRQIDLLRITGTLPNLF